MPAPIAIRGETPRDEIIMSTGKFLPRVVVMQDVAILSIDEGQIDQVIAGLQFLKRHMRRDGKILHFPGGHSG